MSRLRPRGDEGAYAILYGLLMLAMVGAAALVVDLGALRENRRQTRLASDAAAVYGARQLDVIGKSVKPRQACLDAWDYLGTNLGFTVPATTQCTLFPELVAIDPVTLQITCPTVATTATGTAGDYTVYVTWPVFDTSPLLTRPDVRPDPGGAATQQVNPEVDGTNACARIAVQVQQLEHSAFGGVFGVSNASTVVSSVARSTSTPGSGGPVAALNVLEPNDCDAILTQGQGSIEVDRFKDQPGLIAVDSSARGSCGPGTYAIDVTTAVSGGHVWANALAPDGVTTTAGGGTILSYALNPSPTGNPTRAYNPATVPPGSTLLMPKPTVMTERFGATPVTYLYDCTTASLCSTGGGPYVTNLVNAYKGPGTPGNYSGSPSPYNTQSWTVLGSAANVTLGWPGCTIGGANLVFLPAHNYYIDCDTLLVRGVLVFGGGNVVVRGKSGGGISVASFGCLAVNVPLGVAACPTRNALGDLLTPATTEAILYLRAGDFAKGSQASLFTERTFVYTGSGVVNLVGGSTGTLYMTNPRTNDPLCTSKACVAARFSKLALWSNAATASIGGQTGLVLRGVLFMPNAQFTYTGAAGVTQTAAQFWARTLVIKGQGVLKMAPDETGSIERPELSTALIR